MLNPKSKLDFSQAIEGVLITKEQYVAHQKASKNANIINNFINHEINKAYKEADAIKDTSYRIGYEEGLSIAISCFDEFLNQRNHIIKSIYAETHTKIEEVLEEFFNRDEVIVKIFRKTIEKYDASIVSSKANAKIEVFLPNMKSTSSRLANKIKSMAGTNKVEVKYHDNSRYIIKKDDQIVVFDAKEKIEGLCHVATHYINFNKRVEQFQNDVKHVLISKLLQPETHEET